MISNCTICEKEMSGLVCHNKWCGEIHYMCSKCKAVLNGSDTYEYRGAIACEGCFDEVRESREFQRQEIISEENHKTKNFKGLDLGDSPIGKANREILKPQIEIASKESGRLKSYERGEQQ